MVNQQQPQPQLYHSPQQQQQQQQHSHSYKSSPMGQQQNLEQIQEETTMDSVMAGMESGEYFSQMQLQSPQLPQATFSIQQSQPQMTTPMMTPSLAPQYDFSTPENSMSVSTPLLPSQSQTVFDMSVSAGPATMVATPTIPSSALLPSAMDGSTNYIYPQFTSSANPLFSSPPTISSSGTFSPPMASTMPSYFTHPPQHQHHHQYFSNNVIIPPGGTLQTSTPPLSTPPSSGGMVMTEAGMNEQGNNKAWLWDSYPTTNPTPSMEALMQQQQREQQELQEQFQMSNDISQHTPMQDQQQLYQQQQQQQGQMHSPPQNAMQSGYAITTPPLTPQRHPRLFHSQSQPGLRNLQQKQQIQHQHQQNLRRRQHSVHFPSEFLSGDLSSMKTTRHVSLPVNSYSAPIPSLASLSEMMRESPSGEMMAGAPGMDGSMTMAETATLLSMSLPASNHGFSFLDTPPPMHHQYHGYHSFLPTSPPLSSTDASAPSTPKARSRAGSKSRSRPTSTSSVVSVRNVGAPYSPSMPNSAAAAAAAASAANSSRSPSLVPMSPPLSFHNGSSNDPDGPSTPAYETGLIIVPGTQAAAAAAAATAASTGGKAKRISRTKVPTKARSRSSTITSTTGSAVMSSPFSLVLSEQDEKTLQGLAEQTNAENGGAAADDIDPFQLDATAQLHHQQGQYQNLDAGMFDLSMMDGTSSLEDGLDADGFEDGVEMDNESLTATGADAKSSSSSSSSPAPTATSGKPIPCPIPSCSKSFARPFNLNLHVKSHDTLKPYGCHLCSRAFARTDALCRHYKVEEPCRLFMTQDEVRKQAQQQVQQQLHQEQVELQQAQQAHAEAQAQAQAEAQQVQLMMQPGDLSGMTDGSSNAGSSTNGGMMPQQVLQGDTENSNNNNNTGMQGMDKLSSVLDHQQQHHLHPQQQHQQQPYMGSSDVDLASVMTPSAAGNNQEQDQAQP
ncbi:hypothetical protein BGZ75_000196 [Mortierella antarctica]|nr:hypothetical protein BGZ75_000196 [Mortierella antarctica]